MAHIIVVGNEKGGAGKSTVSMHVATALAAGTGVVLMACGDDGDDVGAILVQNRIDDGFNPDSPCHEDSAKFDYAIFRHEPESYKMEYLQGIY